MELTFEEFAKEGIQVAEIISIDSRLLYLRLNWLNKLQFLELLA